MRRIAYVEVLVFMQILQELMDEHILRIDGGTSDTLPDFDYEAMRHIETLTDLAGSEQAKALMTELSSTENDFDTAFQSFRETPNDEDRERLSALQVCHKQTLSALKERLSDEVQHRV